MSDQLSGSAPLHPPSVSVPELAGLEQYWRGDGDTAYLDKVLRYQPVEMSLDESVSWRFALLLLVRGWVASFIVWCLFALIGVIALASASSILDEDAFSLAMVFFMLAVVLGGAAFWVVLLATRIAEPIAEWRVLLADRRDSADSVYSQIAGTLRHRRSPMQGQVKRIGVGDDHDVRNRLVLTDGPYTAYVSVFGYGTSLFLGWTMWRSRWGVELLTKFAAGLFAGLTGRNSPELKMIASERARAMREAVHAACREGLFVGVTQQHVGLEFGFPEGLPQVRGHAPSAPAPVQPVPPGAPAPVAEPAPSEAATERHTTS